MSKEAVKTKTKSQLGYPPRYNVVIFNDDFTPMEFVIKGTSEVLDDEGVEFLHKGIAERNFIRTFKLAEFVEVKEAKLEDGLLVVSLFRNVPDALKPQSIKIT